VAIAAGALLLGHHGWAAAREYGLSGRILPASPPRLLDGPAGTDAPGVPPPPFARRLKTLTGGGPAGSIMVRYVSDLHLTAVVDFYNANMHARGWSPQPNLNSAAVEHSGTLLSYSNPAGNSCIISLKEAEDGETSVSVLRLRASPRQARRRPRQRRQAELEEVSD
jgi:hypothetical protein